MSEGISGLLTRISENHENTHARARETPNVANEVQYPDEFNNCVPVISAVPMQLTKAATIIIATESKGYPEESFNTDVATTLRYFKIDPDDRFWYQAILLKPVHEDLEILHSADARRKLQKVVELMNRSTVLYAKSMEQSSVVELPTGESRTVVCKEK